jgi:uncharacterized protein YutE (UPF0331/DUF86 family)
MPVKRELVERKISLILEDLERLKALASLSFEDFLGDPRNEALAERYLERMTGRVIDINFHLLSEERLQVPRSYHDSFIGLAGLGVLDAASARRFARLAGLRNRLTHEYNGVDEKIIHETARTLVAELPELLRAFRAHLDSPG